MSARPSWRDVRRLLVVRLDNLGDLLMTTPALAALRGYLPEAHITLLGSPGGVRAQQHLAMIDAAHSFDAPWVRHAGLDEQLSSPGCAEAILLHHLRQHEYDAAVIFTTCTQSALPMAMIARQAGIPLRLAHCRENPYALLTDWVQDHDEMNGHMRHEVRRQLDLVAAIGASTPDERLRFQVHPCDEISVATQLERAGVDARRAYVAIHPGASAASRRWPPERFGAAADLIAGQTGCKIVFCGSAAEAGLVEAARATMRRHAVVCLAGELSLGELAALIDGASLLVCNNSAPAHLAAALGTPVVDLYALTNPQHTPWRVPSRVISHDVPCRWCLKSSCPEQHHDCLNKVEPVQVANAAIHLMHAPRRCPRDPDARDDDKRQEELAA